MTTVVVQYSSSISRIQSSVAYLLQHGDLVAHGGHLLLRLQSALALFVALLLGAVQLSTDRNDGRLHLQ